MKLQGAGFWRGNFYQTRRIPSGWCTGKGPENEGCRRRPSPQATLQWTRREETGVVNPWKFRSPAVRLISSLGKWFPSMMLQCRSRIPALRNGFLKPSLVHDARTQEKKNPQPTSAQISLSWPDVATWTQDVNKQECNCCCLRRPARAHAEDTAVAKWLHMHAAAGANACARRGTHSAKLGATWPGSVIIHAALNKGHLRQSVFSSHYSPSGRLEGPKSVLQALPVFFFLLFSKDPFLFDELRVCACH